MALRNDYSGSLEARSATGSDGFTSASEGSDYTVTEEDDYDVLTVLGDTMLRYRCSEGETFESVLVDCTATNTSFDIAAMQGGNLIRNIGVRGKMDPERGHFVIHCQTGSGEETVVENFYARGKEVPGDNHLYGTGGVLVYANHAGTLTFRNYNYGYSSNNGIYGSNPGTPDGWSTGESGAQGTVIVENSFVEECASGGFRIGSEGSRVLGSTVVAVDADNRPPYPDNSELSRGHVARWDTYSDVLFEDCHSYVESSGSPAYSFNLWQGGTMRARDCQGNWNASPSPPDNDYIMEGDTNLENGNPDPRVPCGCPDSAEQAALGSGVSGDCRETAWSDAEGTEPEPEPEPSEDWPVLGSMEDPGGWVRSVDIDGLDGIVAIAGNSSDEFNVITYDLSDFTLLWGSDTGSDAFGIDISPDGEYLAVGYDNGETRIHDPVGGSLLQQLLDASTAVSSVAFSPDSQYLALGTYAGRIFVYDTSDWSQVSNSPLDYTNPDATSRFFGLAFSADGSYLAGSNWDNQVPIIETSGWTEETVLSAGSSNYRDVAWHPDGLVAYVGGDEQLFVHTDTDWSEHTVSGRSIGGSGWSVTFSPNGDYAMYGVYGSSDTTVLASDPEADEWPVETTLQQATDTVLATKFDAETRRAVYGGRDTNAHVHSVPVEVEGELYEPPENDEVDFELLPYTVPDNDSVDFTRTITDVQNATVETPMAEAEFVGFTVEVDAEVRVVMTKAHVFPEDAGTNDQVEEGGGDEADAADFAQAFHAVGFHDFVVSGVDLVVEETVDLTVTSGKLVLTDSEAEGEQSGETRSDVAYVVETQEDADLTLSNDTLNGIYAHLPLDTDDGFSYAVVDEDIGEDLPEQPRLKVAEIDTTVDPPEVTRFNRYRPAENLYLIDPRETDVTSDPTADTPDKAIRVDIDGTTYEIPLYQQ